MREIGSPFILFKTVFFLRPPSTNYGWNMQMCTCLSAMPAILTCQLTIHARMHCF